MRVFLSWSGARSRSVADALHDLIEVVLPRAKPWVSSVAIASGQRWQDEVARNLAEAEYAIIVVTPENLSAPWLLFEAGALAMAQLEGRCKGVCPYLVDLHVDLLPAAHPLRAFQARMADHDGTLALFQDLEALLPKRGRSRPVVPAFLQHWPDFADEALPEWEDWDDDPVADHIEELTRAILVQQAAALVPTVRLAVTFARILKDQSAVQELTQIQRIVMTTPMVDTPPVVFERLQTLYADLQVRIQSVAAP